MHVGALLYLYVWLMELVMTISIVTEVDGRVMRIVSAHEPIIVALLVVLFSITGLESVLNRLRPNLIESNSLNLFESLALAFIQILLFCIVYTRVNHSDWLLKVSEFQIIRVQYTFLWKISR